MNRNILVIDDDKIILDSYKWILMPTEDVSAELEAVFNKSGEKDLQHPNFHVKTAAQGEYGYRLAKEALDKNIPFAVAFIDMRMPPGWDGLKTAKAIRELDDRIYIVIVTAYADKSVDELQKELKHNILLLRKPFNGQEIYQLARNLCNSWLRDEELNLHRHHLEDLVKNRTAALEKAKQFNENIIHTVPSGLVVFIKRFIISISISFRNMFQLKRGEYEGKNAEEFFNKFSFADQNLVNQILSGEFTKKEDIRCYPFNRSKECYLAISLAKINMEESKTEEEFLLVVDDVTHRKLAEKKRKEIEVQMLVASKMATLGEVSTGVAHEMNQPLTFVSGFLQNLSLDSSNNKIQPEKLKKRLTMANQQINRMSEIIKHLQTFGRKDIALVKEDIQIFDIFENAVILVNKQIQTNNVFLVKNVQYDLPTLRGNAVQLEQVFINLLQNALDILDEKQNDRKISVTIKAVKKSMIIEFQDNGSGLSAEIKEKIFEPFFTTKEVGKGTGLGLSITYGIIKDHGGTIKCNSVNGEGTTFVINLPIEQVVKNVPIME